MSFTIQRILGIAPVMVLGLLLLTPAPGLAQVDLVVTSLTPPPATALPGDAFVVTAGVRNQGTVAAGVSITKFELVPTAPGALRKGLEGVQNISALAPGASAAPAVTVEIDSNTVPGTYFLQACANGKDPKIPESNTNNNCLKSSGTITVLDVPELVMKPISEPPPSVPQGQGFGATYTVKNKGAVSAAASWVKFSLVPTVVGQTGIDLKIPNPPEEVGVLGPGATFTNTLTLTVRPETVPGTYRMKACADYKKAVVERDEDNNCKTSVGTVQVTPQRDLLVKKVTVTGAPLTVDQGESLTITLVVRNDGPLDAPASTLKLRLVSTVGTPPPQKSLGTVAVPVVPKGTKVTLIATPIVDDETEPGSYNVQACANYGGPPDKSKSNDCAMAPGTVTVTGLPLSAVDLAVTALTPPPATRLPGETFPLTATVKNNGTAASPPTTSKFYLVNALVNATTRKNLKGVQIVDPLAVGATNATAVTVEVYSDTVPGSYFLQACADGEKQLHEIEEDDNCRTSPSGITVLQVPDLVITQVGNPPPAILPGKSFPVTETVKNIGPVDATLPSRVKFILVSTVDQTIQFDLNGSQDVPALNSNAIFNGSGTVTVRPETLPGSYRMLACADAGKVIFEGDEDTNCLLSTGAVQVGAVPDLIVFAVKLPPPPVVVTHGGTITLTTVVRNQGLGDAGASSLKFSLVLSPGAAPIKKIPEVVPVAAVAHGAKQVTKPTLTIPNDTPAGTYFVQACVDKPNVVEESSDENNCGTSVASIQVQ